MAPEAAGVPSCLGFSWQYLPANLWAAPTFLLELSPNHFGKVVAGVQPQARPNSHHKRVADFYLGYRHTGAAFWHRDCWRVSLRVSLAWTRVQISETDRNCLRGMTKGTSFWR